MSSPSNSDEELFDVVINQLYMDSSFVYDDPLLVSGALRAVVEGNIDKVKQMIESGKSVNINDNNGNTPLHISVIKNNLEILEYLLSRDEVVVNVRNFRGETPLFHAVKNGKLEAVKKLIKAGANVNLPNNEDISPLHVSVCYPEIAHLLILQGAQIDAIDYNGDTPLHDATVESCLETVCMLLYYNADANVRGGNNLTPFIKSLMMGNIEIQDALFEYVDDFNLATGDHMTTLAIALTHETPYVEEIINRGADVNYADFCEEDIPCAFTQCLNFPNSKNFALVWKKLQYNRSMNSLDMCLLFEYLQSNDVRKYMEVIIESENFKPAVESFTRNNNFYLFVNLYVQNKLDLELLTVFTCCLLQGRYRVTSFDIYSIFTHYSYCELVRILTFMDNNFSKGWLPTMVLSQHIFEFRSQLRITDEMIHAICKRDVIQLLQYFIHNRLIVCFLFRFANDVEMRKILDVLPTVPSLLDLARNKAREHIIKLLGISTLCQFNTVINYLNISSVYKKILTLEKTIYKY